MKYDFKHIEEKWQKKNMIIQSFYQLVMYKKSWDVGKHQRMKW